MTISAGVNLLWLRPGQVGGSQEYLVRQLAGLAAVRHEFVLTLYVLPDFADAHPELADHYELAVAPVGARRRPARIAIESTWLSAQARRRGHRFVHHGGGTIPAVGSRPAVLTVHDLQYLTYPQFVSSTKRAYLRAFVPRSVRQARVVCVPSEFVRGTIVQAFGVDPARIVVVANTARAGGAIRGGVDVSAGTGGATPAGATPAAARPPGLTPAMPTDLAELRLRYGVPERFVVYPAVTWPHKNHDVLLRALATAEATAARLGAVLLGGEGPGEAHVRARIAQLGLGERVVRPGRVPDVDRDGFYATAVALAFPSFYEGFGVPVLEAMAAGCAVVAADATALPEVVGDAGLLVDPHDVAGWSSALVRLVSEPAERAELVALGLARAATFTARRSAEALLSAYRLVPVVSR